MSVFKNKSIKDIFSKCALKSEECALQLGGVAVGLIGMMCTGAVFSTGLGPTFGMVAAPLFASSLGIALGLLAAPVGIGVGIYMMSKGVGMEMRAEKGPQPG